MHQSRILDPITQLSIFSHGAESGTLIFGYNAEASYNKSLNLYASDITQIYTSSFNNPITYFFSCNSGTNGNESFAAKWQHQVGGVAWAYEGKSDYTYISARPNGLGSYVDKYVRWYGRIRYGFNPQGSTWYPTAASNAKVVTFG